MNGPLLGCVPGGTRLAAELAALVGGSWVGFGMAVLALPVIPPLTFRRCDPAGHLVSWS
jgi:hypothetical protein